MFQNPKNSINTNNQVTFSKFLNEVDDGRVVEVNIQGQQHNWSFIRWKQV